MPPRNTTRRRKRLLFIAFIFAVPAALIFAVHAWYLGSLRPLKPDSAEAGEYLKVEEKTTAAEIGQELEKKQLIRSARAFAIFCRASGKAGHLHPGVYRFSPAMTVQEIATALAEGRISAVRITVPEGFTLRQIAHRLEQEKFCRANDFLQAARPYALKGRVGFRPPPIDTLEGYLFPSTYTFNLGLPLEDAVAQMAQEFEAQFVSRNQEEIRRSSLSLHQIVILASLVEREAKVDAERPVIAGVLLNRLKIGMKLQCDATVQYALPEHKSRLSYDDLKIDSPYNTYKNKGLPPGPIACPGVASLEAALHPARVPYLYYVAKGNGAHTFTKTYEEHLKAAGKKK